MRAFAIGLDLGREQDFSALSVVEYVEALPAGVDPGWWLRRVEEVAAYRAAGHWEWAASKAAALPTARLEHHVRHLQRWPLGTRYLDVVDEVGALVRTTFEEDDRTYLVADRTGVGYSVEELIIAAYRRKDLPLGYRPTFATITGGEEQNNPSPTYWHIPKKDLISTLQVGLQNGTLKVAAGIPLGEVLEREFMAYRMKITQAGRASYDIARKEGEGHGDLLMATALALQFFLPSRKRLTVGTHER